MGPESLRPRGLVGRPFRFRQVGAGGKAFGAGERGRTPGLLGCLSALTRSPVLIGALNAVSTFIRSHAAARFVRFFGCTATPYCGYWSQKLSWRMNHSRRSSSVMSASAPKPSK